MAFVSSPDHETDLCKEENPRWLDRGHECAQRRHLSNRRRREGKTKPLDPLAEVVGVRDICVEVAAGDAIVLALLFALRRGRLGSGFPLGPSIAPDVEEDFVVENVADKASGPERNACPERGACEGVGSKKGGCSGGAEVRPYEGPVDDVEGDTAEGNAQVGF